MPHPRPARNAAVDPRFDMRPPDLDNQSQSDVALSIDAITDKLEYAVHRTGLTPRLKILMAALRRALDFGDVKFKTPTKRPANLLLFLANDGPLQIFAPTTPDPTYILPTPTPSFIRPRPRY